MIPDSILHYKIEKKPGEGGMGEVFLATDTKLDRQVAIRLLSSDKAKEPDCCIQTLFGKWFEDEPILHFPNSHE